MLDWRLRAYRHWQDDERADVGPASSILPSTTSPSRTTRPRSRRRTLPRASMKWTPSCWRPTKSSAFLFTSARRSPGSRSTRCSTASRSRPRSRIGWQRKASCSVRSPKRSGTIRRSWSATSGAWCPTPTTSSPPSIPRCSATAPSCTCPRESVVQWSCPRTFASTRRIPVSSSARSSWSTKGAT